jgi:glycosyltransferase involved in cell wall biosynthesis
VTSRHVDDGVDNVAIRAFTEEHGAAATALPPLAIVIAAYNEEGAIGPVVAALPDTVAGLAAAKIVVSDGAVDATAKEAAAAGAMVCEVPVNRGQGAALRLGYRIAREGGARYIVTTDADGQYNPAEIERLLAPVLAGEADFVTGSRRLGSEESRDPVRRLGVRVFALAISALTGQRISDTTFGLRAMRAEVTGTVRLEQPQYQAAELLIGVITHGYRVVERPATIHKRTVGTSKKGNNMLYGLSFAQVVAGTWWRERQRRAPRSRPGPSAVGSAPLPGTAPGASANGAAPGAPGPGTAADAGSAAAADPRSTKRT